VPSASGKILVIRGGAIGDFILTLPVLAALRQQFPDIHRELLGYPRIAELALAAGLVERVQSIDARPMASFFARGGKLPQHLADYFAEFALIISFLFDPDRIFQENVARTSKAQFIVGPYRPDENGDLHATEAFLQPLTRLAIFDPDPVPRLALPSRAKAGGHGGEWLALHPGSGSARKNWPETKWVLLLERLLEETRFRIMIVGGEAEGERLERLASLVPPERLKLARNLSLTDLGTLLQQCAGFVGHDSGISHLAAAVGLRSVLLWGHTRPEIWQPRNDGVILVRAASGLEDLSVDEVSRAIRAQFGMSASQQSEVA
jgi:heptosyltransferase III